MKKIVKKEQNEISTQAAVLEKETEASVVVNEDTESKPKGKTKKPVFETKYFDTAKVTCSCGTTFTVGSTKPEIRVEVCSKCHPFFTGQAKFVDTEGRVEAFQRRVAAQTGKKERKQTEKTTPERPKSLKEMLNLIEAS